LPQSRHRKTAKAHKKPQGTYAPGKPSTSPGKNRQLKTIAIVIIVALALGVVAYVIANRRGSAVTTASGLKFTDVVVGTGETPKRGQMLEVHYTGTLENGTKFDSSHDRGQPMQFRYLVQPMIKGWDEGLATMKVGGKRKLIIPSSLGYGPQGRPPTIPGNATLLFDVELVSAK
jgi:hypothetical protein